MFIAHRARVVFNKCWEGICTFSAFILYVHNYTMYIILETLYIMKMYSTCITKQWLLYIILLQQKFSQQQTLSYTVYIVYALYSCHPSRLWSQSRECKQRIRGVIRHKWASMEGSPLATTRQELLFLNLLEQFFQNCWINQTHCLSLLRL